MQEKGMKRGQIERRGTAEGNRKLGRKVGGRSKRSRRLRRERGEIRNGEKRERREDDGKREVKAKGGGMVTRRGGSRRLDGGLGNRSTSWVLVQHSTRYTWGGPGGRC